MSDVWKRCEGQLVDNQFLLQKFVAATTHSVVFLAQTAEPQPRTVAIKFIPAEGLQTHQRLALWNRAAQLTHKNLLRVFHSGQCNLARTDLLYVVMEYGEEDLSQVVPQRALTPEEAREMMPPLMDALSFLHCNGLVHGHLKPSNILAIADQLKLSPDALSPLDEFSQANRDLDVYDAPETSTSPATPARDVWSLGATLLEILTQQPSNISSAPSAVAEIPATVPEPFREIIRLSLSRDPLQRPNLSEITERLNPTPVKSAQPASVAASPVAPAANPVPAPLARSAAAASSSAAISSLAPLSVPLSTERAVPLAQLRQTRTSPPKSIPLPSQRAADRPSGFPNFVIPLLLLGVILVIAFLATPRLFRHISESANAPANSASLMNSQKPQPPAPKILSDHPVVEASSTKKETAAEKKIANESLDPFATHSSPLLVTKESAAKEKPVKENFASPEKPVSPQPVGASAAPKPTAVQNQVLPQVSQKALSTINGVVRVVTLVHLDASGNVSDAELQEPGPSKYFAAKAQQAAQRWKFNAPENGNAWQIRFEFSKSGVQAFPSPQ
jgi:TonB family protein